jgi:hypothetical protein
LAAYRPASIERDVETIARLYDFFRVFWHGDSLPEDHVDYLIYAYLLWRHSGTLTGEGSSRLGGLRWRPLAAEGLRAEFASINRYLRFCSQKWGYVALGRMRRDVRRDGPPLNRMRETAGMKERDFFVHLSASREYWASHFGSEVEMPPVVTRPARSRSFVDADYARRGGLADHRPRTQPRVSRALAGRRPLAGSASANS